MACRPVPESRESRSSGQGGWVCGGLGKVTQHLGQLGDLLAVGSHARLQFGEVLCQVLVVRSQQVYELLVLAPVQPGDGGQIGQLLVREDVRAG